MMQNDSLLNRSVIGFKSVGLLAITKGSMQFFVQLILLRMLAPEVFGIFVFTQMIVGFLAIIASVQGRRAIIKEKDDFRGVLDTSFTYEFCLGIIISLLVVIFAPSIASQIGKAELVPYLQVLALSIVLGGVIGIQRSIFERSMDFRNANISAIIGTISNGILSISLALMGFGIWSLVVGILFGQIVELIVLWKMLPVRPRINFNKHILLKVVRFGLPISLSGIFAFLYSHIDYFLIGKMLGDLQLGYYWFGYSLSHHILAMQNSLSVVIFSAFSNAKNKLQLKNGFLKATKLSASFFLLPCVIILVLGKPTIIFIFGEKWLPALLPFQVLIILASIRGIVVSHWSSLYMLSGKTINILFISIFYFLIITFFGYLVIPRFGIVGMSLVVLVALSFSIPFAKITLRRIIRFSYLKLIRKQIVIFVLVFFAAVIIKPIALINIIAYLGSIIMLTILYGYFFYIIDREFFIWCREIAFKLVALKNI